MPHTTILITVLCAILHLHLALGYDPYRRQPYNRYPTPSPYRNYPQANTPPYPPPGESSANTLPTAPPARYFGPVPPHPNPQNLPNIRPRQPYNPYPTPSPYRNYPQANRPRYPPPGESSANTLPTVPPARYFGPVPPHPNPQNLPNFPPGRPVSPSRPRVPQTRPSVPAVTPPMPAGAAKAPAKKKHSVDLVFSPGLFGLPMVTGLGVNGHIWDPFIRGRYTKRVDVVKLGW